MTTLKSSLWFSGQRPLEQFIISIILPLREKFMLLCEMLRAEATAPEQVYARSGGIFIKLKGADCRFPLTLPAQTAAPPAPTTAPANPGCHSTTDFAEIKVVQCWNPKNPFPRGGKYSALVGWYDKGYTHGLPRARTAASHCKPVCKALQLTGVHKSSRKQSEKLFSWSILRTSYWMKWHCSEDAFLPASLTVTRKAWFAAAVLVPCSPGQLHRFS